MARTLLFRFKIHLSDLSKMAMMKKVLFDCRKDADLVILLLNTLLLWIHKTLQVFLAKKLFE